MHNWNLSWSCKIEPWIHSILICNYINLLWYFIICKLLRLFSSQYSSSMGRNELDRRNRSERRWLTSFHRMQPCFKIIWIPYIESIHYVEKIEHSIISPIGCTSITTFYVQDFMTKSISIGRWNFKLTKRLYIKTIIWIQGWIEATFQMACWDLWT